MGGGDMALKHERELEREQRSEVGHFSKTIKANCTSHTLKILDQLMHRYKILSHPHVF